MPQEGQVYSVTITGCASEGQGVARIDGQVVFVKGALAGERCRVTVEHVGHRAAWARLEEVLELSPHRVTPPCPYYGQCGGCQTQHMAYPSELAFKSGKVRDALARIGGIDPGTVVIHGAQDPWRYRNKVQFPAAAGPHLGYYRERTHQVIDIADCLLTPQLCVPIRQATVDWMAAYGVSAYDEKTGGGLVRHLYIRSNQAGQALVCVLVNGKALPHEKELVDVLRAAEPKLIGVSLGVNQTRSNVILGERYRLLWGQDYLMDTLCGLSFKLSVPSFYQVNRDQAEALYGLAGEFAGLTGTETVLDLYCGTGTIGLTLAGKAKELLGVEIVPQAVEDAKENAARNGIRNASFLCADAGQAAARLAGQKLRPDVVIVDPPRKGLSPDAVDAFKHMAPARVVYVSCDPATLARDLKELWPDYGLTRVEAVDMFPRTHHVETVCLLERGNPS